MEGGGNSRLPKDIVIIGNSAAGHTLDDCDYLVTTNDATSVFQEAMNSVGTGTYAKHLILYLLPANYYFTPTIQTNNGVEYYLENLLLLPINVSNFELYGNGSTIFIDETSSNKREVLNSSTWQFIKYQTVPKNGNHIYDLNFNINLNLAAEYIQALVAYNCNLYRCQFVSSSDLNLNCTSCEDCRFDKLRKSLQTQNYVSKEFRNNNVFMTEGVTLTLGSSIHENLFHIKWNTDEYSIFNSGTNFYFHDNTVRFENNTNPTSIKTTIFDSSSKGHIYHNYFQVPIKTNKTNYILNNGSWNDTNFSDNLVECGFTWKETVDGKDVFYGDCTDTIISNNRFTQDFVEPNGVNLFITGNIIDTIYTENSTTDNDNSICRSNNVVNKQIINI